MVYVPRFSAADVDEDAAPLVGDVEPSVVDDGPSVVDDDDEGFDELHPAPTMRMPVTAAMSFLVLIRNCLPLAGSGWLVIPQVAAVMASPM
jgi:hypothetical protein